MKTMRIDHMKRKNSLARVPYLLLFPAVFVHTIFFAYPLLKAFYFSFTEYNGIIQTVNFLGLKNYVRAFRDMDVLNAFINTFIFTFFIYIFQTPFSILLGVLVSSKVRYGKFFRTVYYLPCVISTAAIGYIFSYIYNPIFGAINPILEALGFKDAFVDILGNPSLSLFGVISVGVWATFGTQFIIYLAALQSISDTYYEVAEIEGANSLQKFKYITFPFLAPAITIVAVLCTVFSLQEFNIVFIMTNGGPGISSQVVTTYIYKRFGNLDYGYATAVSVLFFVVILVVSTVMVKLLGKREENLH